MAAEAIELLAEMRDLLRKQISMLEANAKQGRERQAGQSAGSFFGDIGNQILGLLPPPVRTAFRAGRHALDVFGSGLRAFSQPQADGGGAQAHVSGSQAFTPATIARPTQLASGRPTTIAPPGALPNALPTASASAEAFAGAEGAGGAMGAAAALGPVGIAAAALAAAFIVVKAAIWDIPVAIRNWTHSLLESQRAAAQFSPQLAGVFLGVQAREQVRERAFGEATAGSTGDLASSLMRFEDELVPIRVLFTNFMNTVGARLLDILSDILETVNTILDNIPGYKRPALNEMTDFQRFQSAAQDLNRMERERRQAQLARDRFGGR